MAFASVSGFFDVHVVTACQLRSAYCKDEKPEDHDGLVSRGLTCVLSRKAVNARYLYREEVIGRSVRCGFFCCFASGSGPCGMLARRTVVVDPALYLRWDSP